MQATLALDDDLMEKAQSLTGTLGVSELIREALKALIQLESAKQLALLGGTEPGLHCVPRRRTKIK